MGAETVLVIHERDDVAAVEQQVRRLSGQRVHLVSTDDLDGVVPEEFTPRRLRLMLLLARLADRGIGATGEDLPMVDRASLAALLSQRRAGRVLVSDTDPALAAQVCQAAAVAAVPAHVVELPPVVDLDADGVDVDVADGLQPT